MYIIIVTLIAILLDVVTGFVKAFFNKSVNSTVLRNGGKHKVAEIFSIVLAIFVKYAFTILKISIGFDILIVICTYIIIMECISIIENIGDMNSNALPNKIRNLFEKLRKEIE